MRAGLPLRADDAAFAARFWLVPSSGPAWQDGNILRYDETRPTWQVEVWGLVCGRLLSRAGLANTPASRAELARHIAVELGGAPRLANVRERPRGPARALVLI